MAGGLVGPARKADASAGRESWQVPALKYARVSAPLERQPRLTGRFVREDPDTGAGPDTDEVTVTLRLTREESRRLRSMLHEAVTNDLDLLEDTLHQTELVDSEAVARVALAVRLDVAME